MRVLILREDASRTRVGSSSIRVEEVGIAREDGNVTVRMGAVHGPKRGITFNNHLLSRGLKTIQGEDGGQRVRIRRRVRVQ